MNAQLLNADARSQLGSLAQRRPNALRLVLEGLALAIVLTGLLGAIFIIGSQSVATQTPSQLTQSSASMEAVVCSTHCRAKARPHTTTSRQPGARAAAEQGPRGDG